MSPRPRETSDQEMLAATMRVMSRLGPAQITLADVAREAGVVPATLIQRFGTKRGLLLATARSAPPGVAVQFAAARAKYKSPLKTLVELFVECTGFASTPEAMAIGLAYLQNDLTDPDFRAITLDQFTRIEEETRKLLDEAVRAREIVPCKTAELARLVQTVYGGSMIAWAVYRKGSVARWVRRDLLVLLKPYRRGASSKSQGSGRRRTRTRGRARHSSN